MIFAVLIVFDSNFKNMTNDQILKYWHDGYVSETGLFETNSFTDQIQLFYLSNNYVDSSRVYQAK